MSNQVRYEKFSDVVERFSPGPLHSTTANELTGDVPIISQSETGFVGFHDGTPGVDASPDKPVVTFANHTCAVRWHESPFSTIQNVFPLRGYDGILDTGYLYWFLKQAISPSFYGGHWPMLVDKPVPVPPIQKQRQIAARLKAQLTEVDKARQAAETQLRDADILGQRIFNKIWAELDSVPRKPLGDYAQTTSGSTPARSNKQYWQPAEIAWVKTAEVAFAPITKTEEAISQKALAECSLTLLPPKTVLIAMYGQGKTRGQSAILEIPATTNQACFAVLPNDTWEPEFLFHWLKFSYQDLRTLSEGRGGNQANLNGGLLKALQIPTPDKPTQKAIIARIAYMLTEIEAVKNRSMSMFNDINLLPQKILAQAFQSIPE